MWEKIIQAIIVGAVLAIDAFSVTVANCTGYKNSLTKKKEWAMPVCFAVFQMIMPLIGYYIGSIFSEHLNKISGFLTAGIFFALSLKIVIDKLLELRRESKSEKTSISDNNGVPENTQTKKRNFGITLLLIQGVATSIDALFVGVTFVGLGSFVFIEIAIIGAVTFAIVTAALFIGKSLGSVLGKYAEWAGAIILFALALKELIQALV